MKNIRLIARLDVKAPNLIKGVRLEGLRKIGDPNEYARLYYEQGADEILYMDIVASLYERNSLLDIVERTTKDVFIPITVGGGIRSVEDARAAFRAGADKIAINTAAVRKPEVISDISRLFGSQAVVLSIEAKRKIEGTGWEVYTDNGRERTGLDVIEWAVEGARLGCGEILLTSVDQEGTRKGFDLKLIEAVSEAVNVPVIASGGLGDADDVAKAVEAKADAVAMADILHYKRSTLSEIRDAALEQNIEVRRI